MYPLQYLLRLKNKYLWAQFEAVYNYRIVNKQTTYWIYANTPLTHLTQLKYILHKRYGRLPENSLHSSHQTRTATINRFEGFFVVVVCLFSYLFLGEYVFYSSTKWNGSAANCGKHKTWYVLPFWNIYLMLKIKKLNILIM